MTPNEFAEYVKAFGLPGAMAIAMFYLWLTRQTKDPGKSRLEEDIADLRAMVKDGHDDMREIRERVVRIETKLEGKR